MNNPQATLAQSKVQMNDLLLIESGKVLAKGHIKVAVYVDTASLSGLSKLDVGTLKRFQSMCVPKDAKTAASPDAKEDPRAGEAGSTATPDAHASPAEPSVSIGESGPGGATTDAQAPGCVRPSEAEQLLATSEDLLVDPGVVNIGEVQLSQASTVAQLRTRLLTLPLVAELHSGIQDAVAGVQPVVRLRELLGQRLGRILWSDGASTLKSQKVGGRISRVFLAAQVCAGHLDHVADQVVRVL